MEDSLMKGDSEKETANRTAEVRSQEGNSRSQNPRADHGRLRGWTPHAWQLHIGQVFGHAHQKRQLNNPVKIARIQNPAPSFLVGSTKRSHGMQYLGIVFSYG
jgi:hypothetical protein